MLASALVLASCGGGGGGGMPLGGGDAVANVAGSPSVAGTPSVAGSGANLATPGSAVLADIADSLHKVDPSAYRAMAAKLSTDEGIAYRYGSAGAANGVPTVPQPNDHAYPKGTYADINVTWQVGGPHSTNLGDDYSSNQGQAAFVSDDPKYLGVSTLEFMAQRENTFSEKPQLSWVYAGNADGSGGMNDANALSYKASAPTALGRCYGRPTWCVNSIMAFQSGLLGTAGSNTADNRNTAQLASGNVPTAVAITNGGEFALVTVWDTANVRGRIAVVALSEKGTTNWGGKVYPGLPNYGNVGFMKIIGYVELPDMAAPTEISVTTGVDSESMHRLFKTSGDSNFSTSDNFDLGNENLRQTFAAGGLNANTYAKAGVAVVLSKSERKVAFIDLKPLFAYYQSMYFGSAANFAKTATVGQGASQWPFAFSTEPKQTPTLIKTVSLPNAPTAVKASLFGNRRAWVATAEGTLHIYSLGDYAYGGNASPSAIAETGSVPVGTNPTHIAYDKHDTTGGASVIVVSRGQRKIDWVTFSSPDSGSVSRTLSDSRLIDPIAAEDNDTHGTESYVLTTADYGGKQIANYRYGPVIFHTNPDGACSPPSGCGMAGAFEFGGALALPGKAFQVTGANVP